MQQHRYSATLASGQILETDSPGQLLAALDAEIRGAGIATGPDPLVALDYAPGQSEARALNAGAPETVLDAIGAIEDAHAALAAAEIALSVALRQAEPDAEIEIAAALENVRAAEDAGSSALEWLGVS